MSIFGKPPEDLDLILKEGQRKSAVALSDHEIVESLKKAGGKIKKAGKFLSLIFGEEASEAAKGVSKVADTAAEIGKVVVEIEEEVGIPTSLKFDHSQDAFHTTSHDVGDHFIVPEQHAPAHPVPHAGSFYTYIPNRPSDNKTNTLAVS